MGLRLAYRPLGDHIHRTVTGTRHLRVERVMYRAIGVDPDGEQSWPAYARAVLAFSAVSVWDSFNNADAGVTTLTVATYAGSLDERLQTLRTMAEVVEAAGLA